MFTKRRSRKIRNQNSPCSDFLCLLVWPEKRNENQIFNFFFHKFEHHRLHQCLVFTAIDSSQQQQQIDQDLIIFHEKKKFNSNNNSEMRLNKNPFEIFGKLFYCQTEKYLFIFLVWFLIFIFCDCNKRKKFLAMKMMLSVIFWLLANLSFFFLLQKILIHNF